MLELLVRVLCRSTRSLEAHPKESGDVKVRATATPIAVAMVDEEADLAERETLVAFRLRRLRDLLRLGGPTPFVGCLSNEEIDRLAA
jgi:hypothetical protein